jgi:hypothetical protein
MYEFNASLFTVRLAQLGAPAQLATSFLQSVLPVVESARNGSLLAEPPYGHPRTLAAHLNRLLPANEYDKLNLPVRLESLTRAPDVTDEKWCQRWLNVWACLLPWSDWDGPIPGGGNTIFTCLEHRFPEVAKAFRDGAEDPAAPLNQCLRLVEEHLPFRKWSLDRFENWHLAECLHALDEIVSFFAWLALLGREGDFQELETLVRLLPRSVPLGREDKTWVVAVK